MCAVSGMLCMIRPPDRSGQGHNRGLPRWTSRGRRKGPRSGRVKRRCGRVGDRDQRPICSQCGKNVQCEAPCPRDKLVATLRHLSEACSDIRTRLILTPPPDKPSARPPKPPPSVPSPPGTSGCFAGSRAGVRRACGGGRGRSPPFQLRRSTSPGVQRRGLRRPSSAKHGRTAWGRHDCRHRNRWQPNEQREAASKCPQETKPPPRQSGQWRVPASLHRGLVRGDVRAIG